MDEYTLYVQEGMLDENAYVLWREGSVIDNILKQSEVLWNEDIERYNQGRLVIFTPRQLEHTVDFIGRVGLGEVQYKPTRFFLESLRKENNTHAK